MSRQRWLSSMNWRFAIGEVVLIVVGILIAMAAQDWYNRRTTRRAEVAALSDLRTALSGDLTVLDSVLVRHESAATEVEILLHYLRSGAPYADSLDAYFGAAYGFQAMDLNRAAYESLKSRGLDLVSDDGLRSQLAGVYERVYPRVQASAELEQEVILGVLRPYFLVHFRDLRFSSSATPLDYSTVRGDPVFLNLVDYRLQTLRQTYIPRVREATEAITMLVAAISAELGRP